MLGRADPRLERSRSDDPSRGLALESVAMVKAMLKRSTRAVRRMIGYGTLGSIIALLVVFVVYLDNRPDLSVWHHADLDEEFTTRSDVSSLAEYLSLEDRLFAQLDEEVYRNVPTGAGQEFNRYSRGSLADPGRWPVQWNRTFEWRQDDPAAGVLLLHGLSDAPYSLQAIGKRLHGAGAWVVGLRIPGHGTAPSGLVAIRWQNSIGDKPFYLVGYSNGGALSVHYVVSALEDAALPKPAGVVLLSPAIGVSRLAVLAVWQGRLGHLLGLEKLAWSSIQPEYEPFKYGSFAINAGDLAYRLTLEIRERLNASQRDGRLRLLPPILAFQSIVDATASTRDLVEHLFARLPPAGHELVLFDINRQVAVEAMLRQDPSTVFKPMLQQMQRRFDLTVVTNESDQSSTVVAWHNQAGSNETTGTPLARQWPSDVYSLAHVALPFPPEDPIYGGPEAADSPGIQLGHIALRGERGVLRISGTDLLRLRWNPFYEYVASKILQFMGLQN